MTVTPAAIAAPTTPVLGPVAPAGAGLGATTGGTTGGTTGDATAFGQLLQDELGQQQQGGQDAPAGGTAPGVPDLAAVRPAVGPVAAGGLVPVDVPAAAAGTDEATTGPVDAPLPPSLLPDPTVAGAPVTDSPSDPSVDVATDPEDGAVVTPTAPVPADATAVATAAGLVATPPTTTAPAPTSAGTPSDATTTDGTASPAVPTTGADNGPAVPAGGQDPTGADPASAPTALVAAPGTTPGSVAVGMPLVGAATAPPSGPTTLGQSFGALVQDSVTAQVAPEVVRVVARGDGVHRMVLRLHPADLGEVRVVVTVRDGSVDVALTAGAEAGRRLASGAHELRNLLESLGGTAQVVVREAAGAAGGAVPTSAGAATGDPTTSTGGLASGDGSPAGADRGERGTGRDADRARGTGPPGTDRAGTGPPDRRDDPSTSTRSLDLTL